MTKRTYPRSVWILRASMKPVEVTVVKNYGSPYTDYGDLTEAGKLYPVSEMYPTKADAIAAGRRQLGAQEVRLALQSQRIAKRRAALDKAEAQDD